MQETSTTSITEANVETVQVPISRGYFVTIDKDDYERVTKYKWTALPTKWTVYARRNIRNAEGKQHSLYLHRFLMEPGPGIEVDHKDGNGLNCVRSNMRLATKSQNSQNTKLVRKNNTSGIKGVSRAYKNKWQAVITYQWVQHHLGYFDTKEEAAAAYKTAALMLHKDFHKLE